MLYLIYILGALLLAVLFYTVKVDIVYSLAHFLLIALLGFLVPVITALYWNRKSIFHEHNHEQKRILYIVPVMASGVSIIVAIILEILFVMVSGHDKVRGFYAVVWPILGMPIYILSVFGVSFVISLFVYFCPKKKHTLVRHLKPTQD